MRPFRCVITRFFVTKIRRCKHVFFIKKFSVEESESHIVILFLLGLFLLLFFLLLGSRGSCSRSGSGASSSRGGSGSRTHVSDQGLYVHGLQGLGEQTGPVGLNLNVGGLEDGGDLFRCDGDIIISQDEGGVDAGELGGRHFCLCASRG